MSEMTVSTLVEARALLLRAHYRLMENPRFWYEQTLLDASRILCVRASDINLELLEGVV
jgi:hypothetical protein